MNALLLANSRRRLDERFEQLGPTGKFTVPVHGWVKAIRQALGMTTAQLSQRMGIKQPSVVALEQSEVRGSIELASLRRAAEALDCTLVYALIPNRPLEDTVRSRARACLRKRRSPVEHSMLLENQKVSRDDSDAAVEELLRTRHPRRLWDQSGSPMATGDTPD